MPNAFVTFFMLYDYVSWRYSHEVGNKSEYYKQKSFSSFGILLSALQSAANLCIVFHSISPQLSTEITASSASDSGLHNRAVIQEYLMKRSNRCMLFWGIAATSLLCACSQSPIEKPSDAQSPAEKQSDAQSPIEPQLAPQFPTDQQLAPNVPTNPTDDAKQSGDAENEETGVAVVKQTKPVTPCKDGGSYQADLCLCGEMTNPPDAASQWVCFGDFLRCLRAEGCAYQDRSYPKYTEIHSKGVYCGEDRIPENMDGFFCTGDVDLSQYMLSADIETNEKESKLGLWRFNGVGGKRELDISPRREYWQCEQMECDCHGVKIGKSDICLETKVLTMLANPGPSFLNEDDNDCKGMAYPAKSERFGYDCNGGRWICIGKDCECPKNIEDGTIKYKTIHLGDICDMKPITRALNMTEPEKVNSQNGTKCKNSKCICNASIEGDKADDAEQYLNNPKCYCGNTIIGPSSGEGNGGCYSAHHEELTVYCLKDAAEFSDDDEFDSNTELYTIKIDSHVTESGVMCEDEFEDDETEENQELAKDETEENQELAEDETEENQELAEDESEEDVPSPDDSVPQTNEAVPSTDAEGQGPVIDTKTVSEPKDIERKIYEDIRFWYDDKYQICMNYMGCACAESICPMSTSCAEGKCIDPLTGQEVKDGGFISTVQCMDEATCGCSSSCGKNEWCVAGKCYSELFSVIYQDKRLLYNPFGIIYRYKFGYGRYYSNNNKQYQPDELREYNFGKVSFDIMSKMEKGYAYTDHLAHHVECCDGERTYTESDLRCVRSMGCPCGSSTCGMGGLCKENKCIYDSHYLNMMCYPSSFEHYDNNINEYIPDVDDYDFDEIDPPMSDLLRVDDAGNCLCNRAMLTPELLNNHRQQYVCDDYGWVCTDKKGCPCGDATCDYKALCLKPGLCTAPFEIYQKVSWSGGDRTQLIDCVSEISDVNDECCHSGVLDKDGKCCMSGVVGSTGYCCPSQHVSSGGQCTCIPDKSGQCCFGPVLDRAGYCCPVQYVTDSEQCTCMDSWTGMCCVKGSLSKDGSCLLGFYNRKSVKKVPQLCEYGETEKKQGVLDKEGNCCQGVLSEDGKCCESGVIRTDSENHPCCDSGKFDTHGKCCDVNGVFDKQGQCCDSGALDKDGECCPYGVESGVCNCKSGVRHASGQCCPEKFVDNSENENKCTCAALDKEGDCCESGVLSKTGYCCPADDVNPKTGACRHSIDRFGDKHSLNSVFTNDGFYCESGILLNDGETCCQKEDVQNGRCLCSVYSGYGCCENGIKDKEGYCCPTGVLSDNGLCCPKHHVGSHGQCLCLIESETHQCAKVLYHNNRNDGDLNCESGILGVNRQCCRYGSKDKFGNCCDDYGVSNGYCLGYD